MYEDFAPKLARVLTEYSQPVEPGQRVTIAAETAAMPLIEALYEAVLRRGGFPVVLPRFPNLVEIMMHTGSDDQLAYRDPVAITAMEQADVVYFVHADSNVKYMSTFSADRLAKRSDCGFTC